MPNETDTTTGTADAVTSTSTPETPPKAADAPTWNHREFVELKQDVRKVVSALSALTASPAPIAPAKASPAQSPDDGTATRIAALESALIRQAAKAHGLEDTQVELVQRLYKAERPDDVDAWVSSTVTKFGAKPAGAAPTVSAPASPPAPPAPNTSDRGAPAVAPTGSLPPLNRMSPELFRSLKPEERRELVTKFREGGQTQNPLRSSQPRGNSRR